jgi:hypothetical protein
LTSEVQSRGNTYIAPVEVFDGLTTVAREITFTIVVNCDQRIRMWQPSGLFLVFLLSFGGILISAELTPHTTSGEEGETLAKFGVLLARFNLISNNTS